MVSLYVFDLDGTIANIDHRLKYIKGEKADWDKFFKECVNDSPITWIIELMQMIDSHPISSVILILSGRSSIVGEETVQWLEKHKVPYQYLFMREEGDYSPDEVMKKKELDNFLKDNPNYKLELIVDDRQKVVDMWRDSGYNVLQCNAWEE